MRNSLQRAFTSFLAMPSLIIVAFVLLAVSTYVLKEANPGSTEPAHRFMRSHVFGEPETTSNLLGTIATGIITITSRPRWSRRRETGLWLASHST
ncbi:MAG: hypothetical protein ACR2GI_05735 [Thermomicrobiales bacterium]